MKAVVAALNLEKVLVGAFSVIVKTDCETDRSFYSTTSNTHHGPALQQTGVRGSRGRISKIRDIRVKTLSLKIFYHKDKCGAACDR